MAELWHSPVIEKNQVRLTGRLCAAYGTREKRELEICSHLHTVDQSQHKTDVNVIFFFKLYQWSTNTEMNVNVICYKHRAHDYKLVFKLVNCELT